MWLEYNNESEHTYWLCQVKNEDNRITQIKMFWLATRLQSQEIQCWGQKETPQAEETELLSHKMQSQFQLSLYSLALGLQRVTVVELWMHSGHPEGWWLCHLQPTLSECRQNIRLLEWCVIACWIYVQHSWNIVTCNNTRSSSILF